MLVAAAAIAVLAIVGAVIAIYSRHTAKMGGTTWPNENLTVTTGSVHGGMASAVPTVVIDGQDQKLYVGALCSWQGENLHISDVGVEVWIIDTDPPVVHAVDLQFNGGHLAMIDKLTTLTSAQATKNGRSYRITGTAVDLTNTSPPIVKKSFEIDVTCP